MSWRLAAAGLLGLAACAEALTPVGPQDLEWKVIEQLYARAFEESFQQEPFMEGSLAVLVEEGGELSTYNFFACREGRFVCLGSPQGPAGQLFRSDRYYVLSGIAERTFWFSFGGDGWLQRGDQYVPLAWNARRNGTGDGTEPALETPFPH